MFFKRISDLRIDNDKTQQEIADILICNRQVYARYEKGIREIPVSMLIKIADYYQVNVDYILGLTDNPIYYEKIWISIKSFKAKKSLQKNVVICGKAHRR